jgi:hypothetical protein
MGGRVGGGGREGDTKRQRQSERERGRQIDSVRERRVHTVRSDADMALGRSCLLAKTSSTCSEFKIPELILHRLG